MAGTIDAWVRGLLEQQRRMQTANGAQIALVVMRIGEEFLAGRIGRTQLAAALLRAEEVGFLASARIAAAHLEAVRAGQGVGGVTELAGFDRAAAAARASSTLAALDRVDGAAIQRRVFSKAGVWADRAVKMGGRGTVVRSARASGRRWRRVTDADPCAFCAMLATRGFLDAGYLSEASALWDKQGQAYHDYCGCTATEIVGDLVPNAREQAWIDAYEAAAGSVAPGMPVIPETVLPHMKAHGGFHDSPAPKTQTSGGAGGGGGGKPPFRGMLIGEPDDPARHNFSYDGPLGVLREGEWKPPAPVLPTHIAPVSDPYVYYLPEERRTAEWLAERLGIHTRSIKERGTAGIKSPDSWVDAFGWTLEIKNPRTHNFLTLVDRIREGSLQSSRIVVQAEAPYPLELAEGALAQALSQVGGHLEAVIIEVEGGYLVWTK